MVLCSILAMHTDLSTSVHDGGDTRDEVGRLLTNFGCLVVESPEDGATDLGEVRLHTHTQRIHHNTKPIQHYHILKQRQNKKLSFNGEKEERRKIS